MFNYIYRLLSHQWNNTSGKVGGGAQTIIDLGPFCHYSTSVLPTLNWHDHDEWLFTRDVTHQGQDASEGHKPKKTPAHVA